MASSVAHDTLAELRAALRRAGAAPKRPEGAAQTGVASLDALLEGGLPRGRLTELSGRRSTGRTALSLAALAAATKRGEAAALVDVGGAIDVRRAAAAGVELQRLLWARAADAKQGAKAADLILSAGGFGLLVLDLGEEAPRLPDVTFLRLARGAERAGAALLLVAPPLSQGRSVGGSAATIHLEASRPRAPRFVSATGRGPHVLVSLGARFSLLRARRGGESGEVDVDASLYAWIQSGSSERPAQSIQSGPSGARASR